MFVRFCFALIFFITSTCVRAQDLEFIQFNVEDGLSHQRILSIAQDTKGFMWFGTMDGLNRYDGYEFKTYRHDPEDPNSLIDNWIESLFVDHEGVMWVGTPTGMCTFNSETGSATRIPLFSRIPDDNPDYTFNTIVTVFYEDSANRLWIGTQEGLFVLDKEREQLTFYKHDKLDPLSLSNNIVRSIHEDTQGNIWVGTGSGWQANPSDGGLNRFDEALGSFVRYKHNPEDPYSLLDNRVRSILDDDDGNLWVGTWRMGLHQYDPENDRFIRHYRNKENPLDLHSSYPPNFSPVRGAISFIKKDSNSRIWMGGFNYGMIRYNPASESFSNYIYRSRDSKSLSSNSPWSFYEDKQGVVWIGTWNGLNKVLPSNSGFKFYGVSEEAGSGLSSETVFSVLEDRSENIWFGTLNGLNKYDKEKQEYTHFFHDPLDSNSMSSSEVTELYEDSHGTFWVGTANGLNAYDRLTGNFIHHFNIPGDNTSLSNNNITMLFEDSFGDFWVGTYEGGLNKLDRESGRFVRFEAKKGDSTKLQDSKISSIIEDRNGILWVTTNGGGVARYNREYNTFSVTAEIGHINTIREDKEGYKWVSTIYGLYKLSEEGVLLKFYSSEDGLAEGPAQRIEIDGDGLLWISTGQGLSRFDPRSESFRTFNKVDGLASFRFAEMASFINQDGQIFFGGESGAISFYPDSIKSEVRENNVSIIDFMVDGDLVHSEPIPASKTSDETTRRVRLNYQQNDFSLSFVKPEYVNSSSIRYRYSLEGYDRDWIESGNSRSTRYTNLQPGNYVFSVSATKANGEWDEVVDSLEISILPPWWRTAFAFVVYGLLFVVGVVGIDRFQRRRLIAKERLRAEREKAQAIASTNTELERALKHLTETQDQLIHTEKMASLGQLTAGVAHEIKNPLNFINNFAMICSGQAAEIEEVLEKYQGKLETEDAHELKSILDDLKVNTTKINEHGHRADGIIRSMLEHSRANPGEKRPVDINKLLDEYVNLSYHAVRARTQGDEVKITRDYAEDLSEVEVVPQELGRVFINLLDNAFYSIHESGDKSPESGEVRVRTAMNGKGVEVRIEDNGVGIAKGIQKKIFEPFFTTKPTGSGTGLGLSLSYDIVTQGHGGSLSVESEEGSGAVFIIRLPYLYEVT